MLEEVLVAAVELAPASCPDAEHEAHRRRDGPVGDVFDYTTPALLGLPNPPCPHILVEFHRDTHLSADIGLQSTQKNLECQLTGGGCRKEILQPDARDGGIYIEVVREQCDGFLSAPRRYAFLAERPAR